MNTDTLFSRTIKQKNEKKKLSIPEPTVHKSMWFLKRNEIEKKNVFDRKV